MCELELPENWPREKYFKLRKFKFSEHQFFSIALKQMFDIPLLNNVPIFFLKLSIPLLNNQFIFFLNLCISLIEVKNIH